MRFAAVVLLLTLTGCAVGGPTPGPRVSIGQSPGSPAPLPSPGGALYGRVMHGDGTAATDAVVGMSQMTTEEFVAAAFSLGLLCLMPGPICRTESAKVDGAGRYAFSPQQMKKADHISVYATMSPFEGQVVGPKVSAELKDGKDPQRVPDLRFWEPQVSMQRDGANLRVSWPALQGARYSVFAVSDRGLDQAELAKGLTRPSTTVDTRILEDLPAVLVIVAQTGDLRYSSPGQPVPAGPAAPSRGKGCLVDGKRVTGPCSLTDGDLDSHHEVLLPGECSVDDRSCKATGHRRFCIDLGSARSISLVVVRSPFTRDNAWVELSTDGRNFHRIARWGTADTSPVAVRPARQARYACAFVSQPITGHQLIEISAWG